MPSPPSAVAESHHCLDPARAKEHCQCRSNDA
jgi:hypothetical protein